MPKKKKGGKKKGDQPESAEAKEKEADKKSYEPPGASEKEIALRTEYVKITTPNLYNAHQHKLAYLIICIQITGIGQWTGYS